MAGTGFHGLSDDARQTPCASCHTDHEGRDADIVQLDERAFDHDFTDFPLLGKHGETECSECHEANVKHRAARAGRNPRTGETIQIKASNVPGFKAGKALKEAVN